MIINGVELEFNLYDVDKAGMRNRYFEELKKMQAIKQDMVKEPEQERERYLCKRIKSMFDNVFGSGTGEKVCGTRDDLLESMDAYEQLLNEQIRQDERYKRILQGIKRRNPRKRR
ncbi:MAG TPA: hypothetical protein IAA00_01670 [Candidatus Blautia ornithocaccae]|nr:hypothetical protein [Candidatus Blautia ornithocaccae]